MGLDAMNHRPGNRQMNRERAADVLNAIASLTRWGMSEHDARQHVMDLLKSGHRPLDTTVEELEVVEDIRRAGATNYTVALLRANREIIALNVPSATKYGRTGAVQSSNPIGLSRRHDHEYTPVPE